MYQVRTQRDTNYVQKKTKISRIRYTTRYQKPGTTNRLHHLGTDVTFFLPQPQHLKKTLINTISPPPPFLLFFCISCYGCVYLCLHFLVQLLMCVVGNFCSFGVVDFLVFAHIVRTCYLLRGFVFFLLVTHAPTFQWFCADTHRFTLRCWWLVALGGVGGTNQPTHHPTHPANRSPINSHSYTHTHPATMQSFCADVHRFTMEATPIRLPDHTSKQ